MRQATLLVAVCLLVSCSDTTPVDSIEQTSTAGPSAQATLLQTHSPAPPVGYVGSEACASCHVKAYEAWQASHHSGAMQTPESDSLRGNFDDDSLTVAGLSSQFTRDADGLKITTDGPGGKSVTYPVRYTFGVDPLQQYLLELPHGQLQASALAWDARPGAVGGQRWFHLRPETVGNSDAVLHWTSGAYKWNTMCADCHSTSVAKNYDTASGSYATSFAEVAVGCEACHGPGSRHVDGPNDAPLPSLKAQTDQINACAPCHSRRSQLAEGFTPTSDYLDHYLPSLLDEGLYHADGQILDEVFVYGSFLQSKMHQRGVTCSHCHEVHTGERILEGDGLCTQCHNESGHPEFSSLPRARYDDPSHHFHPPENSGARCVSCHMPERIYMSVDGRRDHNIRAPRPDLTVTAGVPNACNGCHTDRSAQWADATIAERFGSEPDPHYGAVIARARGADPSVELDLALLANDETRSAIVRGTALALMAGYERDATGDAIVNGLRDPNPLVRIGALRASARWPAQRRWQQIRHLLDDGLLAVRSEAARILADTYRLLPPSAQSTLAVGLDEYMETLALNADRAEAQTNIALVRIALDDIAGADAALHRALELNPQWVPAMVNLADLYRASGRDRDGGALLDRALASVPTSADVLLAKGLWLVRQNRSSESLTVLEKAWVSAPEVARFAYVYSVALNSEGRASDALGVLDAQLERSGEDHRLLQTAASIARDAGYTERAAAYAQRIR